MNFSEKKVFLNKKHSFFQKYLLLLPQNKSLNKYQMKNEIIVKINAILVSKYLLV